MAAVSLPLSAKAKKVVGEVQGQSSLTSLIMTGKENSLSSNKAIINTPPEEKRALFLKDCMTSRL